MIKVKIVPAVKMGAIFYCFFELPESEIDPMQKSRDNLETRRDANVAHAARLPGHY
jgi:hypothetical protein